MPEGEDSVRGTKGTTVMQSIHTPMKKGRKIKLIIMLVACVISIGYGGWQVWSRIPQRTEEAETYRAAKDTFDALVIVAGELKARGEGLDEAQAIEYNEAEQILSRFKDEKPQPPSKYDALINLWVWVIGGIVTIPFVLWPFWKFRNGGWILGEDGSLTTPKGAMFPADRIVGIDMSSWRGLLDPQASNRSTWQAKVILADDQKLVIDDYLWEDADKIIAHLAHQFQPENWDAKGELIKSPDSSDSDEASGDDADASEK